MMEIKVNTMKHKDVCIEDYINIPVIDRITTIIDLNKASIERNERSKIIGVITNATDCSESEIELTIVLYKNKFQGEYIQDEKGKIKPMSFSMGFSKDDA